MLNQIITVFTYLGLDNCLGYCAMIVMYYQLHLRDQFYTIQQGGPNTRQWRRETGIVQDIQGFYKSKIENVDMEENFDEIKAHFKRVQFNFNYLVFE